MRGLIGSKKIEYALFSIFLIISFLLPSTHAIEYYADLEITVDNAGFVTIKGDANYPNLFIEDSEEYTSKTETLWTLNISENVTFTEFIFSIMLPEHAEIKSVSSSASTFITQKSDNLVIEGYGNDQSLSILVQYRTQKNLETGVFFGLDLLSIILIGIIIVLILCFFFVFFFFDKREKQFFSPKKNQQVQSEFKGLNDRQKRIIHLLQKSDVALTQTDIQRELKMPKASVSRNIRRLELKGIIEKEQIGMSNIIRLKKP
jgi:uncharacterized membrane protein